MKSIEIILVTSKAARSTPLFALIGTSIISYFFNKAYLEYYYKNDKHQLKSMFQEQNDQLFMHKIGRKLTHSV